MKPPRRKITVLKQICNLIPKGLVNKLSEKYGIDKKSRTFTPWSHVVSLVFAQSSHALSLNDVCDALKNNEGFLKDIRGAVAPKRNTLSNANRVRDADMAEELFWSTLEALESHNPSFKLGRKYSGIPRRFKRTINAIDSTTIKLFSNCMDWAKHRRRKAAAKMHLCLNLQSYLPQFIIVEPAKGHDATKAMQLCVNLKAGEIVTFDKAYIKFEFLYNLTERDVFWVGRAKDNMVYETKEQHSKPKGNIRRDDVIQLTGANSSKEYPEKLRLVEADVEINGKIKTLTFITNNFKWVANSIADLYKSRWGIEMFFKEIKQNLKIGTFLGHNENAVRWQIWTAMLTYILLRFIAHTSKWGHSSFNRLFTILRGVLWRHLDMWKLLESYGTASGHIKINATINQAWLPGLAP